MNQRRNQSENYKTFNLNNKKTIAYQNTWGTAKPRPTGKCIALNSYIRKEGELKIQ